MAYWNKKGNSGHLKEIHGRHSPGRRLLRYLYPYKWAVFAALLLTISSGPLATIGPLLTQAAVDLFVVSPSATPRSGFELWIKHHADLLGPGKSYAHGLLFIAILFLLVIIVQSAIQYCQVVVTESVGQKAIHDLRQQLFSHLQKLPIKFYDRIPVGQLMTRLTADVDALNEMFSSGMVTILSHLTIAIYIAAWMLHINWWLAMVSYGALLAMVGFTIWFRAILIPVSQRFRERIAAINVFLQEHLVGMQIIQVFSRESEEMRKFERLNQQHYEAGMAGILRNALFYPGIEVMALTGIALIIWYGGSQAMRDLISLGSLVAFIQLAQSLHDSLTEIGSKYHVLQTALVSSERIFSLLDEPIDDFSSLKSVMPKVACARIEFRNVWFSYQADDWILKDVSFIVEPGEKVAFVGRTGAGKTTITNLLLRFYEIQRGQILLDNVDIRELDPIQLRSSFAVVLQEAVLFSGDVISNIRLGNHSISDENVKIAANAVHLDRFIAKMPNGYRSELLEHGSSLSVGQKQLVSFARALAFDRPILILDEATSSVDSQTESMVCDAVRKIMEGRTSLIIAHRLSTIQAVDKIFVLHKGEIRESGDHKSLLAQRGLYWKLHQLQIATGAATDAVVA